MCIKYEKLRLKNVNKKQSIDEEKNLPYFPSFRSVRKGVKKIKLFRGHVLQALTPLPSAYLGDTTKLKSPILLFYKCFSKTCTQNRGDNTKKKCTPSL